MTLFHGVSAFIITEAIYLSIAWLSLQGSAKAQLLLLFLKLDYLVSLYLKKDFTGKNENLGNTSVTEGALGRNSV